MDQSPAGLNNGSSKCNFVLSISSGLRCYGVRTFWRLVAYALALLCVLTSPCTGGGVRSHVQRYKIERRCARGDRAFIAEKLYE